MSANKNDTVYMSAVPAYLRSPSQIATQLKVSSDQGLSQPEAEKRLGHFGINDIPHSNGQAIKLALINRFTDAFTVIILIAAVLSLLVGRYVEAAIISAVVFVETLLGVVQAFRIQRTQARLEAHLQQSAVVLRDSTTQTVAATHIVPGDIIEFQAGDKIPADARLVSATGLRVQEAALTGESEDISKRTATLESRTPLANRCNMVYLGTTVVAGSGRAIVTATGARTEMGRIAQILKTQPSPDSPLRRKLRRSGIVISIIVGALVALISIIQILLGEPVGLSIRTAITLIVSAIPEDLSIIFTIALAVAAMRILKQRGALRELSAGESLGAATVICTDKTGTLTLGEMKGQTFHLLQGDTISKNHTPHDPIETLALIGLALASDARRTKKNDVAYAGSSTERCALAFAETLGIDQQKLRTQWRERDHIAFNGKWKYRVTLNDHPTDSTRTIFVTGAPEILLERSSYCLDSNKNTTRITSRRRRELLSEINNLAADGYRLLAVGVRRHLRSNTITHDDVQGLLLLGVLAINDPIRPGIRQAIQETQAAGIAVKIITGDHEATARALARTLGFSTLDESVLTSADLQDMTDEELYEIVNQIILFTRVTPLDKQRIIRALQRHGHVVAMTGDGINDAIALKSADIGVAMGSGRDIAKDAADLVLLDDSFATIVTAIREGRTLRDNVRKAITFLFSTNVAEVATFLVSLVLRLPLPLLPAQILWINIVTDGTADIALALETREPSTMSRPPENPHTPLLDRQLLIHMLWSGLILTVATVSLYWYLVGIANTELRYARTIIFAFMACASLVSTLSFRSLRTHASLHGMLRNPALVISIAISFSLQLLAIYLPAMQNFFNTVTLSLNDWLIIVLLATAATVAIDLRKFFIPYIPKHYIPHRTRSAAPLLPVNS